MPAHRHSAKTRDAALRRLSTLNRLAAVAAVTLALAFTALAAHATPPRHTASAAPSITQPGKAHRPQPRSDDEEGRSSPPATARDQASAPSPAPAAPAPTPQPPVVVSGGS